MATPIIQLSEPELKLLQRLVYRECAMCMDERRAHFLQDRLQKRLRPCQVESFYSYYRLLTSREGQGELAALLENLTINETSFFRNKPQLDVFHKVTLEELLRRKQAEGEYSIRIWSAGCSTGQEPYTIAMLLCDALAYYTIRCMPVSETPSPRPLVAAPWRVEILASDISYSALRTAQEAKYSEQQMEPVDFMYRLRFFDKLESHYAVKQALKQVVKFDFHNLKADFLPQKNDIIFCRNVMIYFDEAEQKRLIDKLYRCLVPGGYLFVGHAETLLGLTDRFRMIHHNNGTVYQRTEAEA